MELGAEDQATVAFVEAKAKVACLAHPMEWHMMRLRPGLPTGIALTRRTRLLPRAPWSPAVPLPCPWLSAAKPPSQRLPAGAPG
jgi:hypothetical protein